MYSIVRMGIAYAENGNLGSFVRMTSDGHFAFDCKLVREKAYLLNLHPLAVQGCQMAYFQNKKSQFG
jgi:hypothetical protein